MNFRQAKVGVRSREYALLGAMKLNPSWLVMAACSSVTLAGVAACASAPQPVPEHSVSSLDAAYVVEENLLITTRDDAKISAMSVRRKEHTAPLPAILQFTIYVRDRGRDMESLKVAADKGYVGVIAYTRGKRHSPDEIVPYEYDGRDAYDVIDWVSKQAWSNGEVGMYGGSYNGFTQWAATKTLHPALETIVPYVASRPGMGLPMENNIFINPNYEWTFYVTNNKTLDHAVGNDRARFRAMQDTWWKTGRAYRELDDIDGTPNKFFQRWLEHPSYDAYWQNMVPYKEEFSQITIPVLSVDGYYNDSQNSGLYYLREHTKYLPGAEHYLIIGPYGHFGAQRGGQKELRGMEVDPVALIDLEEITYQWFDYVLRGAPRPSILKDKINYQVIGTSTWRSAPSLDEMSNSTLTFYLSHQKGASEGSYRLDLVPSKTAAFLSQTVDFKDRERATNDYYPDPIVREEIDTTSGYIFSSGPLSEDLIVNGSFGGELVISINKRDVDVGVSLYERMPTGEYFQLSYYLGRASYAADTTTRRLLEPNRIEHVPLSNTRLVSKKLSKDSRLVAYVNVNKNPFSQLNYGTGKDVSDESIDDAKEPLVIKWHNQSHIRIPVLKRSGGNVSKASSGSKSQ